MSDFELSSLNGSNGFQINGEAVVDHFGIAVASAGDMNGDGFDDLIIGVSPSLPDTGASAYVVFGRAGGFPTNLEISSLNGNNGFKIIGEPSKTVASAGDVNGDGFDDLIIGCPDGDAIASSYVVFGKAGGFPANLELSSLNGTNGFQIIREAAVGGTGYSVASAGDMNGDGFDDLIIGASGAAPNGAESGASYVVFGKAGGFSTNLELSGLNGSNGFQINGEARYDGRQISVASAGDVNGDGFDDLIIGARAAQPHGVYSGASYVVFGKAGGFAANLELSSLNGSNGFQINGEGGYDHAGASVASAGDVNGDGFDDLIIGAPSADTNGVYSGASYVVFGKAGGFAANLELSSLNGSTGFRINGEAAYDVSGTSVASAGDVNGDGFDDLIIGASQALPYGASYVVFGKAGGFDADLELSGMNGSAGFKINGETADDGFGRSVAAAGDVNSDGFDDLIIGDDFADPNGPDSGASYVIFGSATIGSDTSAPWNFSYDTPADMLTFAHLSADSYNGDLPGIAAGETIRPPAGWTAILTTWDGSGAVPVDDAGNPVAHVKVGAEGMQATAYREVATGRVVIAYRGTDGPDLVDGIPIELLNTSIPLGLGIDEPSFLGFPVQTSSYMQSAVDFYAAVVTGVLDQGTTKVSPDMISFAGHSLGGMLAGYLAGITGAQAMVFATGPHSELMQYLDSVVVKPTNVGLLSGAPDYSGLVHARNDGEILGEAVQAAIDHAYPAFVVSALSGNALASALSALALLRWGDTTFEGNNLAPMVSGLQQTPSNAAWIHSMPLHELTLYAQHSLKLSNYAAAPGFLKSFYNDTLALNASQAVGNLAFTDIDAGRMFSDMVLAINDRAGGLEDVLTGLLQTAETNLADIAPSSIGLGIDPTIFNVRNTQFGGEIVEFLSQHFVETAARAMFSDTIDFATALGASRVGTGGAWLRLTPHVFAAGNETLGLRGIGEAISQAMGIGHHQLTLVNDVQNIFVLADPDVGRTLTGTAGNDLIIGASDGAHLGISVNAGAGNDVVVGTGWNDVLIGGSGKNFLLGGQGNDRYVASSLTGSRTIVSDLGGQDRLEVGGTITGYSDESGLAYLSNSLTLNIGSENATVQILDHFRSRIGIGFGRIETIVNFDGSIWRPTTILEKAFGLLEHAVKSVASGATAMVTTAIDAVDQVTGTIAEYGTRAVQAIGAGTEDIFRFLGTHFSSGDAVILGVSPGSRLAVAAAVAEPTTHVIDIDANSDGIVDASVTLVGSYVGLGLSVTTDGADTLIRLTFDPTLQFDIVGDDALNDAIAGTGLAEKIGGLSGNDSLSGLAGNDTLMGGAGNDTLAGGSGLDRMFGGGGDDLYIVNDVADTVVEFFGEGTDTIKASVSYGLLTPVENLVLTGSASLNGIGNSLNNRITGNAAGNRLDGLDGHDTMISGLGNDTVDGGAGNDALYGGEGNDSLTGGVGNDRIDGGAGLDYAYYTGTVAAAINLSLSIAQVTGHGTDTLIGIENLASGGGNDTLIGNSFDNILDAGDGNDSLDGGGGNDAVLGGTGADDLTGGTGNDRIDGGDGFDTARFLGTAGVVANLTLTTAQNTGYGFDILQNIENVTSGSGNDILTGDTLANLLSAGFGNDMLVGGAGNDGLYADSGADTLDGGAGDDLLDGGVGIDTVVFSNGTDAATVNLALTTAQITGFGSDIILNIENLTSGEGNDRLTGNFTANILTSGAGNDNLYGGTGDDLLFGGLGNDLLTGGSGNDLIDGGAGIDRAYFNGMAAATVNLSVLVAQATGYGTDTLVAIENVTSGSGNDSLMGDAFANALDGGSGNDSLYGSGGNDLLTGGLGDDRIDGGAGSDRAYFIGALAAVVNLNLTAAQNTGYGLDTLVSIEHVTSGNGNDRLTGNALGNSLGAGIGNDVINGGGGNDSLTGGTGADTFVFNAAFAVGNVDRVTDFNLADDTIQLENAIFTGLASGMLADTAFVANATGLASDTSDRIIYETDTGSLYFDADGTGAGARVQFAILKTGLAMTNVDFFVI